MSVNANYATFDGNDLEICGNFCRGRGARCKVRGNFVDIRDADGSTIWGNYCKVRCANPATITVYGHFVEINGRPAQRTESSSNADVIVDGGGVVIDNSGVRLRGNAVFNANVSVVRDRERDRERDRARDRSARVALAGIAASRAIACSVNNVNLGVGSMTGGNISVHSAPGSGHAVVVIDDDDDDDEAAGVLPLPTRDVVVMRGIKTMRGGTVSFRGGEMRITSPSAANSVRVVASSAFRPPPDVVPRGHKCTEAGAGETACAICMANRVDAVLQPCGHANLCVDCARVLYDKKEPCPTCRKNITSVVAAFFGGVAT